MDQFSDILWNKCIVGLAEINHAGKFTKANPAFCDLLGYNESELQTKHWEEITHPTDAVGSKAMLDKCFLGEVLGFTMENRYITKRGTIVWVNLHVSALPNEENIVKYLLKQVISTPIILPLVETKKEEPDTIALKDNWKLLIAAAVGCLLTGYGLYFKDQSVQTLGLALVTGLFAGFISKK